MAAFGPAGIVIFAFMGGVAMVIATYALERFFTRRAEWPR